MKSEEAARTQFETLQIQLLLMLKHDGCRWLLFKTVFLREGWQSHKPCARQRVALANPPANKRVKQAKLRAMVFRQLATDARAPVTNVKLCWSDWLLHKRLTSMLWTVAMVPPVLVITSVHADAPTHILPSAIATIAIPLDL